MASEAKSEAKLYCRDRSTVLFVMVDVNACMSSFYRITAVVVISGFSRNEKSLGQLNEDFRLVLISVC